MTLHRPESLDEAIGLLAKAKPRVLAGGTDVFPALADAPAPAMMDITQVPGLRGITRLDDGWRIGAATTWTDICRANLPPCFDALKQAAREVGSVQIQNAGTVAGNICNASPAADGVPPLLVLDAIVEMVGPRGTRHVPLRDFILGPRRTALAEAELVTAVLIPDAKGQSAFLKLGARRYLVISIAMVAARVSVENGRLSQVALAVGSCGPVAARLPELESALIGANASQVSGIVAEYLLPQVQPIDDVRASASYRKDAVRQLLSRAIVKAVEAENVA